MTIPSLDIIKSKTKYWWFV